MLLYLAAALIVLTGLAHSLLGERYILGRLRGGRDLPRLLGGTEFTFRTLRFAWHITTVAWFGLAAVLVELASPPVSAANIAIVIGATFFVHFAVALAGSRGRHLSWIAFLAITLLCLVAALR